ncbi:hypothetical protein AVEN_202877-1 [Araneus ventricosus]|uniref:Uncharacterized protein n=1 Tax=Araneus ventricosus TaxID=182803 RepID=A0A4Y2FIG4_ARAVE|nr:hypothetical protein AVEN_202877-1 [Araneus ventricosus]
MPCQGKKLDLYLRKRAMKKRLGTASYFCIRRGDDKWKGLAFPSKIFIRREWQHLKEEKRSFDISSEIFSHVGGLLGCWLGISVFTFTDIMEKGFRKVVRLKKIFKERKEKRAPNSEIHQD